MSYIFWPLDGSLTLKIKKFQISIYNSKKSQILLLKVETSPYILFKWLTTSCYARSVKIDTLNQRDHSNQPEGVVSLYPIFMASICNSKKCQIL